MNYYYAKNEEKTGPLSLDELKKVDLKKDTLIWYDGIDDWIKAEDVNELKDIFADKKSHNDSKIIETEENKPTVKGQKVSKNQKIILINIFISFVFYLIFIDPLYYPNRNPFFNLDTIVGAFFSNMGNYIVFYVALIFNIFKKFKTNTWIIIIIISWAISLISFVGNLL